MLISNNRNLQPVQKRRKGVGVMITTSCSFISRLLCRELGNKATFCGDRKLPDLSHGIAGANECHEALASFPGSRSREREPGNKAIEAPGVESHRITNDCSN